MYFQITYYIFQQLSTFSSTFISFSCLHTMMKHWNSCFIYHFSSSLIIYEPNFQSDCWVWIMCIEFDTQWNTLHHFLSCFHLESKWRSRLMPRAWVLISNRVPDEGTIGSDQDHCGKWSRSLQEVRKHSFKKSVQVFLKKSCSGE